MKFASWINCWNSLYGSEIFLHGRTIKSFIVAIIVLLFKAPKCAQNESQSTFTITKCVLIHYWVSLDFE
jgi:hypothetical protein